MASYLSAVIVAAILCQCRGNIDITSDKDQGDDKDDTYCDSSVEQDLDMQRLKGDWWEVESFNSDSFIEKGDKCHVSHFYPSADNKTIHVANDYVNNANRHKKTSYLIEDKEPKNDGNLVAHLNVLKPAVGMKEVDFDILETDYENFILMKICYDGPGSKHDFKAGLLLVRKPEGIDLSSEEIEPQIMESLDQNNLDRSYFQTNDIKSCAAVKFPETFSALEYSFKDDKTS